jgi:PAS domain S-box-containing protein
MKSVIYTVKCRDDDELFKTLSEELPVGVCIMQDGKFCYVNSTFPIAIGYTVDELVGKDTFEIVVPEDREMVKENTAKMLRGELRSPYQFRVIHKDGGIVWIMATVKSIRYHGRRAILGSYMEVTERKQAEERIRESETRYRLLAENAEDVIWTVDIAYPTRLTYISPSVTRLLGYGVEESMTKEMEAVFTPASFNIAMKAFAEEMAGEQKGHGDRHRSRRLELQLRHKNGSLVDVEVNFSFVHGTDGQKGEILAVARDITERKLMEEAVKESEERYRELANSITDVFFAMDENLTYTYWNKASEILTGVRAQDALGKSLLEIFPDVPWVRKTEKVYRNVLGTQQPQTFMNEADIGDRHYTFEINAYPSRDGISVFVRDVTERKRAEEELRESEQRYRKMFEEALDAIFIADAETGMLLDCNRAACELVGRERSELIGEHQRILHPPGETEGEFSNTFSEHLRAKQGKVIETQVVTGKGEIKEVAIKANVLEFRRKKVIQGIFRDITERKHAEEALRQSEKKYRTILEEMEEGYYEVDLAGNFTFVNDAMCRILGYSRDELIGMNYKTYTHKENVTAAFEAYNRVYRTCKPLQWFPMVEVRKDGTRVLVEDSVLPITDDKGGVIGFRGISRDVTERKQAEEALQKSEERYRVLAENAGEAIFVVQDDVVKFINPRGVELSGYSGEELASRPFARFIYPDDIPMVTGHYLKRLRGEPGPQTYDFRIIRKDGAIRWGELNAVSISWEDRPAVLCFMNDVTEHKEAEEALRQSEEKYRTILEEMEDAYFETDLAGNIVFANNSTCRDLGYSMEEMIGKRINYKDYMVKEDIESVFRVFNEVYRTGVPNKGFSWETVHKDGSHGFAETSVSPLRNDKGEIIGFRGVGRDVTGRKQAEEKLRQSRENYRALFDSSVIGTIVVDAETMRVVMANQAAVEMFRFSSPQEIRGADPLAFIHPGDREEILELAAKSLFEQDSHQTHNLRAVTKDGREIWISATGARIKHEGRLAGLISFTDITEQKRQNERLIMTDRLASIGELASGTAHELNNPLTSIIGFSQLLMEREVPDDIREDLKLINSEAQRAADVTKNLLTFARKHAPVKQLGQISNIIEDVLKLRAYEHKVNNIAVVKQLHPYLPEMMIDYFQMQQVFMNIIINAEYFMIAAHGKGTLTIATKRQNSSVVVSFADDGPGIPPENLKRIFDPFFTTKETGKGTGLGLSICHGIVTEHGGQIYARSQLGKGATIHVELPINGVQTISKEAVKQASPDQRSILIVNGKE